MKYLIEIRPRALKDLKSIDAEQMQQIVERLSKLEDGLTGDVKRLTNFDIGYRLRIGNYRVLFDVEDMKVIVRRIKHRREAYKNT